MADPVSFIYEVPEKSIGGFVIDAFLSEHYSFSNSVTDIPVEEGANISDHIIEDQDVVSVEAFIGDTEFAVVAKDGDSLASMTAPNKGARIRSAYQELRRLKSEKQLLDVVLGLETFTSMVITSFSIDRDVESGANLPFSMEFRKLKVVKSDTTQINASSSTGAAGGDQVAGTTNAGTSGTEQPKENTAKEEWRRQIRSGGPATPADYERKFGVPYPQ